MKKVLYNKFKIFGVFFTSAFAISCDGDDDTYIDPKISRSHQEDQRPNSHRSQNPSSDPNNNFTNNGERLNKSDEEDDNSIEEENKLREQLAEQTILQQTEKKLKQLAPRISTIETKYIRKLYKDAFTFIHAHSETTKEEHQDMQRKIEEENTLREQQLAEQIILQQKEKNLEQLVSNISKIETKYIKNLCEDAFAFIHNHAEEKQVEQLAEQKIIEENKLREQQLLEQAKLQEQQELDTLIFTPKEDGITYQQYKNLLEKVTKDKREQEIEKNKLQPLLQYAALNAAKKIFKNEEIKFSELKVLGEGRFGTVFEVSAEGKDYAIKIQLNDKEDLRQEMSYNNAYIEANRKAESENIPVRILTFEKISEINEMKNSPWGEDDDTTGIYVTKKFIASHEEKDDNDEYRRGEVEKYYWIEKFESLTEIVHKDFHNENIIKTVDKSWIVFDMNLSENYIITQNTYKTFLNKQIAHHRNNIEMQGYKSLAGFQSLQDYYDQNGQLIDRTWECLNSIRTKYFGCIDLYWLSQHYIDMDIIYKAERKKLIEENIPQQVLPDVDKQKLDKQLECLRLEQTKNIKDFLTKTIIDKNIFAFDHDIFIAQAIYMIKKFPEEKENFKRFICKFFVLKEDIEDYFDNCFKFLELVNQVGELVKNNEMSLERENLLYLKKQFDKIKKDFPGNLRKFESNDGIRYIIQLISDKKPEIELRKSKDNEISEKQINLVDFAPFTKETTHLHLMWLNKNHNSYEHNIDGETYDLPFPIQSLTGKSLQHETLDVPDVQFIDRIKGWNACGWTPNIWIDSHKANKIEEYKQSVEKLNAKNILFNLKDVRELEYIQGHKDFFDNLPIYARVDSARIFAMLAGDGLEVYADLTVLPMKFEEMLTNQKDKIIKDLLTRNNADEELRKQVYDIIKTYDERARLDDDSADYATQFYGEMYRYFYENNDFKEEKTFTKCSSKRLRELNSKVNAKDKELYLASKDQSEFSQIINSIAPILKNAYYTVIESLKKYRIMMSTTFVIRSDNTISSTYWRENTFMILNRITKDDILLKLAQTNLENIAKYIENHWSENNQDLDWTNLDQTFYDAVRRSFSLAFVLSNQGEDMLDLLKKDYFQENVANRLYGKLVFTNLISDIGENAPLPCLPVQVTRGSNHG